nr:MAG TPA: hypothetical protein [Caudoviricetes sp.]
MYYRSYKTSKTLLCALQRCFTSGAGINSQ